MAEPSLVVVSVGLQATVQDLGRPGLAHLGVPRSGALDEPAHRLANRLVGNAESAATLECLDGRVALQPAVTVSVAVTGAQVPVLVDGRPAPWGCAVAVPAGSHLEVGAATAGLRAYVAVTGGVHVPEVLGSRSTDLLSGLGPAPLAAGDRLALGPPGEPPVPVDTTWASRPSGVLRVVPGPREDWFEPGSLEALAGAAYVVGSRSDRIGVRLEGRPLRWRREDQLPSEGMVLGAVQVPPNGQPVVFLNDHPTTGGYPVVGVVVTEDLAQCAQLRPGEQVRIRLV